VVELQSLRVYPDAGIPPRARALLAVVALVAFSAFVAVSAPLA